MIDAEILSVVSTRKTTHTHIFKMAVFILEIQNYDIISSPVFTYVIRIYTQPWPIISFSYAFSEAPPSCGMTFSRLGINPYYVNKHGATFLA